MYNAIDFTDIGSLIVTFSGHGLNCESTGKAVSLVAAGTVGLGTDNDPLAGVVRVYEADNKVGVQVRGAAEVVSDTKLTAGTYVVVDGAGKVKDASTNRSDAYVIDDQKYGADGTVTVWLG